MITLESSDLFEATYAKWLRDNLPSYEPVWSTFIGNDGKNNALPLAGLANDKEVRRGRFSQAHYSLGVTAHRIYTFRKSDLERLFPPNPDLDQYLTGHERLFLFMASVGHVRDMFVQMECALGIGGSLLSKDFKSFYAQRSHVIHGPQIPTALDELSWLIPVIAKENEFADEWHKNAIWKAIKSNKAVYASDFIRNTCDALFPLICEVHPKVFDAANNFFEGRKLIEPTQLFHIIPDDPTDITISVGSSTMRIRRIPSGQRDA